MTASSRSPTRGWSRRWRRERESWRSANRELTEALEQQTATSEILRVISSSPTDIQPVLDTVAESAARLCESFDASIFIAWMATRLRLVAHHGRASRGADRRVRAPARPWSCRRPTVLDGRTDPRRRPPGRVGASSRGQRARAAPGLSHDPRRPLMREGVAIGAISIRRTEAHSSRTSRSRCSKTFADQAVIAIENVRLFTELEARNRELTEALEQQTATSEILRVIASSPTDVQPVFDDDRRARYAVVRWQSGHITSW